MSTRVNPAITGLRCLRCAGDFPFGDYFEGCPVCLRAGFPSSVAFHYGYMPSGLDDLGAWQVYPNAMTLGEGMTPLLDMPALARQIDVSSVRLKLEAANPTGSHKDRMSRFVVQRALHIGASTVAAASSGNAGVSLATYAASAGLHSVIVATADIDPHWRHRITSSEGEVVIADTVERRWTLLAEKVRAGEWYPATNFLTPAVGSNPFGVDGYRSVALELFLQSNENPLSDVVVPTSRGDLLWGIVCGFEDLRRAGYMQHLPRVHAVEPFPRLARVLEGVDYRATFPGSSRLVSIGGSTVTFQALASLQSSKGAVAWVDEDAAETDRAVLAGLDMPLEISSAAALSGLRQLRKDGSVPADASVALLATARGTPALER